MSGVFTDEHDITVADSVHAPVEFVAGAAGAGASDKFGFAHELSAMHDPACPGRVDEHGAMFCPSGHDPDQSEFIDGVSFEQNLALGPCCRSCFLFEYLGERTKWVPRQIRFDKIFFTKREFAFGIVTAIRARGSGGRQASPWRWRGWFTFGK